MKKYFALCLAVLVLTGCESGNVPSYSQMGSFPDLDESSSVSIIQSSSDRTSSTTSDPEPEFVSDKDLRHITIPLSNDYENSRTLIIDGEKLTVIVKNGDWETSSVRIGSIVFSSETVGSTTTYTLDGTRLRKGYVNLELWGDEIVSYRLKHDENGYSFPDVMKICNDNEKAAESAKELSYEQSLKYITKDGTADNAEAVLKKIKRLSDKICRGIRTDYEKLRAISQWVSANIYYDYAAYKNGIPDECLTLEYMLEYGTSVCGGYAAMTSALCEAQGIKCLHMNGYAINQGNCYAELNNGVHHEWNYAVIGDKGVWVDSGWNSRSYFYEIGSYSQGEIVYTYFDIGSEAFALDHKVSYAQLRNYFPDN